MTFWTRCALACQGNPNILVRSVMKCQETSEVCASEGLEKPLELWAGVHAFLEDVLSVHFRLSRNFLRRNWREWFDTCTGNQVIEVD